MRLPRRVPWENLGELEQVCAWIYTDENDLQAKENAVNRLAAWKAAVPLPHALESAHAILAVTLQDGTVATSSTSLSIRMGYASSIIRLVNGLVDPLQLGTYARSIHSIAQQLGLPPWLVELRHAATHEDLPSLEMLREAATESMTWLLHNYFLPTLNPSAPPSNSPTLRPLAPVLKHYKTLMKATTRDATLHAHYGSEITKITRDIERWIAEVKVASATATAGVGWEDSPEGGDEEDAREKWALDRLTEVLLEKGMLVPLSKRKRVHPNQSSLGLPRSSIAIWSPLLAHLQSLHSTLFSHIVAGITRHLSLAPPPPSAISEFGADTVNLSLETNEPKGDPSYDLCLASWAKWLADTCASGITDAEEAAELKEGIVVRIVSILGPERADHNSSKAASTLLEAVCENRPKLAAALSILTQNPSQSSKDWDGNTLGLMNDRLNSLLALASPYNTSEDGDSMDVDLISPAGVLELPAGWRKLSEREGWRPAPIGVYIGCS